RAGPDWETLRSPAENHRPFEVSRTDHEPLPTSLEAEGWPSLYQRSLRRCIRSIRRLFGSRPRSRRRRETFHRLCRTAPGDGARWVSIRYLAPSRWAIGIEAFNKLIATQCGGLLRAVPRASLPKGARLISDTGAQRII